MDGPSKEFMDSQLSKEILPIIWFSLLHKHIPKSSLAVSERPYFQNQVRDPPCMVAHFKNAYQKGDSWSCERSMAPEESKTSSTYMNECYELVSTVYSRFRVGFRLLAGLDAKNGQIVYVYGL